MFAIPEHIKKISCPFDRKAAETEFLTAQIELELKEKTSEYYPFKLNNFIEAIENSAPEKMQYLCMAADQCSVQTCDLLRNIVIEYWRDVLKQKYL